MTNYICILRGINVSGKHSIKMNDLKTLFSSLGFVNVQTYIQSGNVVFESKKISTEKMNGMIKAAIQKQYGFDVPVMTFEKDEFENIVSQNPFAKMNEYNEAFFHITFLSAKPEKEKIELIKTGDCQYDEFRIIERAVYLYCPNGYGKTKLNNNFFENKLRLTATTRNWKTVNELVKMKLIEN